MGSSVVANYSNKDIPMTDTQLLDVERIKAEAIQAAQDALIHRLQGDEKPKYTWEERGRDVPESYDELISEVKKHVPSVSPEDIDMRVEAKMKEREDARLEEEKTRNKAYADEIEGKRRSADVEWYDLVKEGKMPAPSQEIQDRINAGDSLTIDEIQADPGLSARLELMKVAKNKSVKLAYYEEYSQQPAGAHAPVFGGHPSTPQAESTELDYERDVKSNRKKIFGF